MSLIDTSLLVIIPHLIPSFRVFICAYQTGFYANGTKAHFLVLYCHRTTTEVNEFLVWLAFKPKWTSALRVQWPNRWIFFPLDIFCQLNMSQLDFFSSKWYSSLWLDSNQIRPHAKSDIYSVIQTNDLWSEVLYKTSELIPNARMKFDKKVTSFL